MSVSIEYARSMISASSRYKDSSAWRARVAKMPAPQVLAIYHNMLARGEFNKKKKSEPKTEVTFHQISLFDPEFGDKRLTADYI